MKCLVITNMKKYILLMNNWFHNKCIKNRIACVICIFFRSVFHFLIYINFNTKYTLGFYLQQQRIFLFISLYIIYFLFFIWNIFYIQLMKNRLIYLFLNQLLIFLSYHHSAWLNELFLSFILRLNIYLLSEKLYFLI